MLSNKINISKKTRVETETTPTCGSRYFAETIPKYEIPDEGMPPRAAYQLIREELNLDGNPTLNLASFVTTWMEPEANQLIMDSVGKNFVDNDEYPQTEKIQTRVVNMLARLFNSPEKSESLGTATIGSSEAIMLGLLAHKWSWKKRREAEGKSYDKPNIVMGADVHTAWEKFALYFDVELKLIPLEKDRHIVTTADIEREIDENTICVGAVLGTTFTGQMDPIKEINDLLVNIKKTKGWNIPIHVDAASGGFITPFLNPEIEWDFRLEQVKSINVSGHKYGLVYHDLPEDLIFEVNYLGGLMPNYSLNFSKASNTIIAQYYNLIRLGKKGYQDILQILLVNAIYLAHKLENSGRFEVINKEILFPLVAVKLTEDAKFTVFELSEKLRQKGWIVPAYTLPAGRDMVEMLYTDIMKAYDSLNRTTFIKEDVKDRRNHSLLY
jgi:glutamate decarboxylase